MKRYITPVVLALLSSVTLTAQEAAKSTPKIQWLQLQVGGGINNSYDMKTQLNSPTIDVTNGQAVAYTNVKGFYNVGVSGMKLATEQLLLGATLNYGKLLTQKDGIAQFQTTFYIGMINIGELLYNKNGLMVYPYGGVGYSFCSMDVKNIASSGDVGFDLNNTLSTGAHQAYTTNYLMFELAVGAKKVINPNFAVGADAGLYISSTYGGDWQNGGNTVTSRKAPGTNGAFINVTLSYGLFQ